MVFIEVQPVPGLSLMRQSDSNWHDSSVWGKKRKRKLLWVCNLSFSILLIEHVEQDNGGVGSECCTNSALCLTMGEMPYSSFCHYFFSS